jgi:hypothetical protein
MEVIWAKKRQFFGKNIFKIITSTPATKLTANSLRLKNSILKANILQVVPTDI